MAEEHTATYNKKLNDYLRLEKDSSNEFKSPFYFIAGADPQLGLQARYIDKIPERIWDKELDLLKTCVSKINNLNPLPAFFAIVGDLCDAMPEDPKEYIVRQKQEKDFFSAMNNLDSRVVFIPVAGNHDVGDKPTNLTQTRYVSTYGPDFYSFKCGGWFFMVINSQYFVDSTLVKLLSDSQKEWLDEKLNEASKYSGRCVVFMHVPPFVESMDGEQETYFRLKKVVGLPLLERFQKAGIKYIFCGHLHKNAGGKWNDIEVITTTAIGTQLGDDNPGFRIVKVFEDKLEHKFYRFEDVPNSVEF